jgi:hypothetical protein
MEFKDIASVSGKSGLYKIVAPTKGGMILESLDEHKKKLIINAHSKVSVLGEIGIYTNDKEGTKPLEQVLLKIHEEFDGDTGVSSSSEKSELASFLKFILPEYDDEKVYPSDIKKLVSWYNLLSKNYPELLVAKANDPKTEESAE